MKSCKEQGLLVLLEINFLPAGALTVFDLEGVPILSVATRAFERLS